MFALPRTRVALGHSAKNRRVIHPILWTAVLLVCQPPGSSAQSFVNWETPHVHPIELTPSGATLLVVNTPDDRLEIFDASGPTPVPAGSIPVGLDPVTVRARSETEVWVVNQVSDTISIIDLPTRRIVTTVHVGDEPCDVVFAGSPQRAFVSVSQENRIRVYDPLNIATIPTIVSIAGRAPRALATDGTRVYAAIFEAGSGTTVLDLDTVSGPTGPYQGLNPPPNRGSTFVPPLSPGLPLAPEVGLIVKQTTVAWEDDNGGRWTPQVTWGLTNNAAAVINAATLSVTYARRLMDHNMSVAVRPDGQVTVVGTDAIKQVRYEPNVRGIFVRVLMARFDPNSLSDHSRFDLNPHLDYLASSIPPAQRMLSIGDPRAVVWAADGSRAYVAGMGSNNVIAVSPTGERLATINVGQGPTGLVLDSTRGRLYVVNKFEASVSVIDLAVNLETARVGFFDPTPAMIRNGRPMLYDTHLTSGLGHVSCASCHVDGRMDNLAWDLGDPSGQVKLFDQHCDPGQFGCENWHPMKGPMTTQTLIGIIGTEPFHWRGDRENLAAFDVGFPGLLGGDTPTFQELDEMQAFLAATVFPPNPNRNFDDSLKTSVSTGDGQVGNAVDGSRIFNTVATDSGR